MAFVLIGVDSYQADAAEKNTMAGIVNTSGTNLNVRSSASTSSSVLAKVYDGAYLTILSSNGQFYHVEYNENKYGYVHKDYVKTVSRDVRQVSAGGSNLNVRYGPSTSYGIYSKVADKEYVILLNTSGNFSRVLFKGNKVGFVSSSYLSTAHTYSAKKLYLTSYKQFDSRWANVLIGNSGKTMQQIGCLTTDMAMLESYRTGTTKTPLTMRNTLSYTSSGDMYWPSNYTFSTASNYLSTAYQLLSQGKPVLIGLKKNSGGQHWVVITGFTGGNSLTASGFTIHDPGSSTRTKLSEVLSSYPNFYKIAYYK